MRARTPNGDFGVYFDRYILTFRQIRIKIYGLGLPGMRARGDADRDFVMFT